MLPFVSSLQTSRLIKWFHAVAPKTQLEHILHFYALADLVGIDRKSRAFELGWAGYNCRVARKAEAFLWQEYCHVHFAVGIFIMQQCDSISTPAYTCKADRGCSARCDLGTVAFRILAAVREEFRIGGRADKDIALDAAQTINADVKR